MKQISSTFPSKIMPLLFFGALTGFVALVLKLEAYKESPIFLIVPCVMAALGYSQMKATLRDLVDEVYDCGDFLLVRKRGEEDMVPLTHIVNVNSSHARPSRITLTLASPGKFGSKVSFTPPPKLSKYVHPGDAIADDLIARTVKARSKSVI